MIFERSCGILLHITSLPGEFGIGTLGNEAYDFADRLARMGHRYWQILPVGPVNGGLSYSPYAAESTFAINPAFISPRKIAEEPWFRADLPAADFDDAHFVDFHAVEAYLLPLLRLAFTEFNRHAGSDELLRFTEFRAAEKLWIDDFTLFTALAEHFGTASWIAWDDELVRRDPAALERWRDKLRDSIEFHYFVQYLAFTQWRRFKEHCASRGIRLIGDIPIYIAFESADAWANTGILQVNPKTGKPYAVAGVPPDYFSATGQHWGNPLYRWNNADGSPDEGTFNWWARRINHLTHLVDIVRIDHFRGFAGYWAIPAGEKTAVGGRWVKGPGMRFFQRLRERLGELRLIAEDLGVITHEVEHIRDYFVFPGMKILQFAFEGGPTNPYLPHNIENENCVLYTGTHDNNTTNGWFYGNEINDETRALALEYLGADSYSDFHWKLIRQAYRSVARLAIIPAQDMLGYGAEFRMNMPGTGDGNWRWKLTSEELTAEHERKMHQLAYMYNRIRDDEEAPPPH